jgi:uncharacterized membrane protein
MFSGLTFFGIPLEFFLRLSEISFVISVFVMIYLIRSLLKFKNGKD